MKRKSLVFLMVALAALRLAPAGAAEKSELTAALMQTDASAQARLVEQARKEGTLTFYTSITNEIAAKLISDFEEKYGIKVKLWRAGDRAVLQKFVSESKTGLSGADIVNIGSLEMEMLHREKVLQPIDSPYKDSLIAGAVAPHKEWVSTFVNVFVQAYNTQAVPKSEVPTSYQDLLNPKWKNRLGIEATDEEWFYALVQSMGEEKGLKYFQNLVQATNPSVRTGHSLLNNLVSAGEVPLGITVYGHSVLAAKKKGQPVDYTILDPAIAVSFSMGISAKPAHPNAALLFYKYMLTDGQKVFADLNYTPTRTDIDTPFRNVHYKIVDKAKFLDEFNRWHSLWDATVIKREAKP